MKTVAGPVVEKSRSRRTCTSKQVHKIVITNICGSHRNSLRYANEEVYKSVNAGMLRQMQKNMSRLQTCLDAAGANIERKSVI